MTDLRRALGEAVSAAFAAAGLPPELGRVTASDRPDLADFQCNGALAAAKQAKANPRELAGRVAEALLATLHRHNITVVLLTAPGKGPNYHALGAVGVIEKPLDVVALARQVRDVLDREVEQTNPAIYSITRRR